MKKFIVFISLLLAPQFATAQPVAKVADVFIKSQFFNHEREVLIYTPSGYDEFTASDYDVMYVFDSQERSKFDLVHSLTELSTTDPDEMKRFIVVGVCSPNLLEIDYYRNTDYLPMPIHGKDAIGNRSLFDDVRGYGHSSDLKKFLKQELMPYIAKNYRTSGRNIGIGHSLSGSFVLDCMIDGDLFDDYIAMSPNYCYDEFRICSGLEQYPFMKHSEPRFIYTSMANEAATWNKHWQEGWQRASAFLTDKTYFPANTIVSVQHFPEYGHNPSYVPSLIEAIKEYLQFSTSILPQHTSKETYPVHIELKGQNMKDEVYITGNQEALANWNPKGIKMNPVNDSIRSIDLQLHLPAYFKFTFGDWDHTAVIGNAEQGNLIIYKPTPHAHCYELYDDMP